MWAAVFLKDGADNSKRPEEHRTEPGTDRTGQEVRKESREESVKQRLHGMVTRLYVPQGQLPSAFSTARDKR